MKQYKLKRDLPTFKAGDEFYLDINNDLCLKESAIMAYNHKTLEKFPNILKDWFEEIHENKRWRAKYGREYTFLSDDGSISSSDEYGDNADDYRYNTGIYGRTREELEAKLEYVIARQVLLDDADGGKFMLKEENYFTNYSVIDNCWHLNLSYHYTPGGIYFKDIESLKKSLEKHKEQWEIVRKYEMGEV